MLLYTVETVPGKIVQLLGLVQGSTVQSKHIGKDLMAGLRGIVGGEMTVKIFKLCYRFAGRGFQRSDCIHEDVLGDNPFHILVLPIQGHGGEKGRQQEHFEQYFAHT